MPISEKQLRANRANAKKSTGPKSGRGKEISSRNAVKHGVYAKTVVIDSPSVKENQGAYEALVEFLHEELQPETALQEQLVVRIANGVWHSRRITYAQQIRIRRLVDEIDGDIKIEKDLKRMLSDNHDTENPGPTAKKIEEIEQMQKQTMCDRLAKAYSDIIFFDRYGRRVDRKLYRAFRSLKEIQEI